MGWGDRGLTLPVELLWFEDEYWEKQPRVCFAQLLCIRSHVRCLSSKCVCLSRSWLLGLIDLPLALSLLGHLKVLRGSPSSGPQTPPEKCCGGGVQARKGSRLPALCGARRDRAGKGTQNPLRRFTAVTSTTWTAGVKSASFTAQH